MQNEAEQEEKMQRPSFVCSNCGGPVQPGSAECSRCGYPRIRKQAETPPRPSTSMPAKKPFKLGSGQFIAILAMVLVIVFVCPVLYFLYANPGTHNVFYGMQNNGGVEGDRHVPKTHLEAQQEPERHKEPRKALISRLQDGPAPELSIKASQLVKAYEDSNGALMRQRIVIDGTVKYVNESSGKPYVVLEGGVGCHMDEAVQFAKGQRVILVGTVNTYIFGDVVLSECRVLADGPVPEGRTAGDAHAVASAQESRPAADICAKTASWDAWFSAQTAFRTEHPECRPALDALQAPSISADRLVAEYRENEVAAEENYKDQVLVVTGEVRSVETDMDGSPRIWLEAETGRGVLCGLALSERRKAAAIRRGQTVSLAGRVGVSVMRTPTMDDAVLLGEQWSSSERSLLNNVGPFLREQKKDCAEILEFKAVDGGAAAEITCSRRGGGTARYLLVLRECRLGSRGDVKELKK